MNENNIRELLEATVSRLLESSGAPPGIATPRQIAQLAWEAVVLLMRETILLNEAVFISGLGLFKSSDTSWLFEPATSLAELEALRLEPEDGARLTARRALVLLTEGLAMLELIPADIELEELHYGPPSPEQQLLGEIFEPEQLWMALSFQLGKVQKSLAHHQTRLLDRENSPPDLNVGYRGRLWPDEVSDSPQSELGSLSQSEGRGVPEAET